MELTHKQVQHFFNRAGFSEKFENVRQKVGSIPEKLIENEIKNSSDFKYIYLLDKDDDFKKNKGNATKEQKKMVKMFSRLKLYNLNLTWLNKMINDKAQLREKMVLYWHNHFACRSVSGLLMQIQNNTLRYHALGNFKELLKAIVSDPAMIHFLNSQQNRKGKINENFGREFLELFTIGRGNYTEDDIKNAARAFTGWRAGFDGSSQLEKKFFDDGTKEFMGKRGNFDSNEIIDIVLKKKQTAKSVAKRFYHHFINNNKVNENHLQQMADRFYDSGYEISELVKAAFNEKFYDEENIGAVIKSPVELLVMFYKNIPVEFDPANPNVLLQRVMGQILLFPPNVAGWPGGTSWIDTNNLIFRMGFATRLLQEFAISVKDNEEEQPQEMGEEQPQEYLQKVQSNFRKFKTKPDWAVMEKNFKDVADNQLAESLANFLVQPQTSTVAEVVKEVNGQSRSEIIKNLTVKLMGLPEYQVC